MMSGCTFDPKCASRTEMLARHGTPEQFRYALVLAIGEITTQEFIDALAAYKLQWLRGYCE